MPTADLVQKLRTCSAEERRNAAMELAKTGSDEAVRELIRMVEGRHRRWFNWYNFDDQLAGVEALGETGSPASLEYLKRVYESTRCSSSCNSVMLYCGGHEPASDIWGNEICETYSYPFARRTLAAKLRYTKFIRDTLDESGEPAIQFEKDFKIHEVFTKTIEKLSKKLLNPQ